MGHQGTLTASSLKRWGIVLIVFGVAFRMASGTLLDWYSDYVGSNSGAQVSALMHLFSAIDDVAIPLGVGFLTGGLVVSILTSDRS